MTRDYERRKKLTFRRKICVDIASTKVLVRTRQPRKYQ